MNKFRAWIPSIKKMGKPFDLHQILTRYVPDENKYDVFPNECVFLRFTGLLDKKGNEIYEGDIVNRTVDMGNYSAGYGQVDEGNFEVFYSGIELLPFSEKGTHMEEYLIVGNIYKGSI